MSYIAVDSALIDAKFLFPLPLVAMEQFWMWDDIPSHPKRFRVVIELSGIVDVSQLKNSIAIAAARHPLLISVVRLSTRPPEWVIPKDPHVGWRWNSGPWNQSPFSDDWDLSTEGGLRIWGSQNGESAEMSLEAHHATCDALGLRQFLRDVFVAYDQLMKNPNCLPTLPSLSHERLKERGSFSRPAPTKETRSTTPWEKIMGAYHFHFRGPTPIAAVSGHNPSRIAATRHYYFRHTFDIAETESIEHTHAHHAQKGSESTQIAHSLKKEESLPLETPSLLNDLAVARLVQVLAAWNTRYESAALKQRLRILIPTDLRAPRDSRSPASNRLGFGFVVSNAGDCGDIQKLLTSIQSQTQAIRKYRLGLDFVEIFGFLAKYPKIGGWLVRRPRCLATAVLTNMGDAFGRFRKHFEMVDGKFKVGNLVVESFAGYPPLRPQTHLGIGLSRCAGKLTMGVIIDARQFSYEQAIALQQQWIQAWQDSGERTK